MATAPSATGLPQPSGAGRTSPAGSATNPPANGDEQHAGWQQYVLFALFGSVLVAAVVGLFIPGEKASFVSVVVIMAGGLLLVALLNRLTEFTLGPGSVSAKVEKVRNEVGELRQQLLAELKKLEQEKAYEINRDLLAKRSAAYGELWARMKASAIYSPDPFGPGQVRGYAAALSDWYFSPTGGLFLTPRSRDYYFPLQRMLREVAGLDDWLCKRRPDDPELLFRKLLQELPEGQRKERKELPSLRPEEWEEICKWLTAKIKSLVEARKPDEPAPPEVGDAIFATIQQLSSVLRTVLAGEVGSREGVLLVKVDPVARS